MTSQNVNLSSWDTLYIYQATTVFGYVKRAGLAQPVPDYRLQNRIIGVQFTAETKTSFCVQMGSGFRQALYPIDTVGFFPRIYGVGGVELTTHLEEEA
jgi:hypothetical protein